MLWHLLLHLPIAGGAVQRYWWHGVGKLKEAGVGKDKRCIPAHSVIPLGTNTDVSGLIALGILQFTLYLN